MKPLCLAFALGLYSAGTAHAGLQDDMNPFFNDMNYTSSTTSIKAWQGQAAYYVSGGSFYARTGNKNTQLVSISLSSINAGCGGTDVYLEVFSFINSDQTMVFVRQAMVNAAGYFLDLALETTVPELKAAKGSLQKMAVDTNRFNMPSYQAAKTMANSVASLRGKSQQNVCQSVSGQKGVLSDWVAFRQGCTPGDKYGSVADKAIGAGKDQVLKDINLVWDAFGNNSLSNNTELCQFTMSISGSVTFDSNGELWILSSTASDRNLLTVMMSEGTTRVYVCDNQNKCLSPTLNNVTIFADKLLVKMVQSMLTSIENKTIIDASLTEKGKQFINSTSISILSWVVDQSPLSVSQSPSAQLTDYITVDICLQYPEVVMKMANGSLATEDYPGANIKELKNGLPDTRQALSSLRMEVQIKEDAFISAQRQIRFIRQQVSSKMGDRVLDNYQFSRMN